MKCKKIFLGIAFGTSVRDVLRNDAFKILKDNKDVEIIVFSQEIGPDLQGEIAGENVFLEKLVDYKPTFWEVIVMHFHKSILRRKSRTLALGNTSGDTRAMDKFTWVTNFLSIFLNYKQLTKLVFWLYSLDRKPRNYVEQFNAYQPDLVVVTRVLNFSKDYPLLKTAGYFKIPVVSLVSSWDNLTSKGFFPFQISKLVVWNDVIKQEAIGLFDFPEEKIVITGIPRYDYFFTANNLSTKEAFFTRFGLDPSKKLILYGTGSAATGVTKEDLTSPEPEVAEFIGKAINGGLLKLDCQLLVRLHPQADAKAYDVLCQLPNVFVHIPGKMAMFQDRLFSNDDDREFAESLKYADIVVNMASTVTIDAAVFDKPIVCINFDFRGERPFKYSVKRLYEFDHYAKLNMMGGFKMAISKEHLVDCLNEALINPEELSENRKRIVKQQCYYTDGKSGERVANSILNLLNT